MSLVVSLVVLLLLALPVGAKTIFVKQVGGTDANGCAAAESSARAMGTLGGGLRCLAGGDTLQLGTGTYTDTSVMNNIPSGTSGAPTILQPIPGDTAILKPFACHSVGVIFLNQHQGYITFQGPGLIIDSGNCQDGVSASGIQVKDGGNHLIFQDMEIRNTEGHGFDFGGGDPPTIPNNNRLTRMKIHNTGLNPTAFTPAVGYCIYLNGHHNTIEDSEIFDCMGGWGIHGYAAGARVNDHQTVRNNWIHHTNTNNSDPNGSGALLFWAHNGSQNLIYNNVISDCRNTMAAVYLSEGSAAGDNLFMNNTITGCQGGGRGIRVGGGAAWTIRNTVLFHNSQDAIAYDGDQGGTVADHNLLGSPDPHFANAGAQDFHLTAGSPAVDAGVPTPAFSTDKDGVHRPQGSAWDLGPYEFGTSAPTPPRRSDAWWTFDEGPGMMTAADATGNGNTLTLVGGLTWEPGKVGSFALHCEGAGGYAHLPTPFASPTGHYTFTAWAKGTTAPGRTNEHVVMNGLGSETWGLSWGHGVAAFQQAWQHREAGGTYVATKFTTPLLANIWYHLGATYDGTAVRVYLNGHPETTTLVTSMMAASGAFTLCGSGAVTPWAGTLDEAKVWNRALSDAEMLEQAATTGGTMHHKVGQ